MENKYRKYLRIFLWLVSLHSFSVGIGLIALPSETMIFFGFQIPVENFFRVQGGVFHLVMAMFYGLAAFDVNKFNGLVITAIAAKFIATIFLFIYYFIFSPVWSVVFSGISDCTMGLVILFLFLRYSTRVRNI